MPDFTVAPSKRIAPGTLAGGACANSAVAVQNESNSRSNRDRTLMPSCAMRGCSGHIGRSSGLQKDHGNRILRGGFGSGMATDASALLATPHPEKSRLAFQYLACCVEQFNLQRLIARNLHEERSVGFHGSSSKQA